MTSTLSGPDPTQNLRNARSQEKIRRPRPETCEDFGGDRGPKSATSSKIPKVSRMLEDAAARKV